MKKHQFKPFDQVLVRMDHRLHKCINDEPRIWHANLFSHIEKCEDGSIRYCANSILWDECIPYNENTAHLLGTNKPYEESEPKVWHVTNPSRSFDEIYTDKELSNFIKTAVINNKDITNFHVMYIP